ncbi:MAG: CehA/McbA family metallohydrolase [bacterium]
MAPNSSLPIDLDLSQILAAFFLLYAEIHYTFKGIYSRLKHDEPEIIADAPHRIEPGSALPILILVKDADRYPVDLHRVQIELRTAEQVCKHTFDLEALAIGQTLWQQIFEIPVPESATGKAQVDVLIEITCAGKRKTVTIDNYRRSSHAPLEVELSRHPLPKTEGWVFGEFHCHTSYTSDQVEFGAPLSATCTLAKAIGLSFLCATDHSYDLDDEPENYLKKDPHLRKWKSLWREAEALNRSVESFVIVPGEEVSAGNHKNRNVHFLILNNPEFLPGDGDGAEHWLQTRPTTSIAEVLARSNSNSAAFAAHPAIRPPFLQRWLVRRGRWETPDCCHANLHGLQVWNGSDDGLAEGLQMWVELLLTGRRIFISAGNDAHGNFNRFRQIGFPFLTMRENHHNVFGKVRTAVYLEEALTLASLMKGVKRGNMVLTNGPFLELRIENELGETAHPGDVIGGKQFRIAARCLSSTEFGRLTELKLFEGSLDSKTERLLKRMTFPDSTYDQELEMVRNGKNHLYLRAELRSKSGEEIFNCFTNPIWLNARG